MRYLRIFYRMLTYGVSSDLTKAPNVNYHHTAIRFGSIGAKFGICNVMGLDGTLVEAKIRT
jgi:hypothetical protein